LAPKNRISVAVVLDTDVELTVVGGAVVYVA